MTSARPWWKMLPLAGAFKMALDVMLGHRHFGPAEAAIAVVAPTLAAIIFYFWNFDITKYFSFFSALAPTDIQKPHSSFSGSSSGHGHDYLGSCPTFGEQGWNMMGGGVGLGVASMVTAAATMTYVVSYWQKIKQAFKNSRRFTVSLEIPESSQYFLELLAWVKDKQLTKEKPQHIAIDTSKDTDSKYSQVYGYYDPYTGVVSGAQSQRSARPMFKPATGSYDFEYNGKTISLEIIRKCEDKEYQDVMYLTTWGRDTAIFETLIEELRTIRDAKRINKTYLYTADSLSGRWTPSTQSKAKRNTDSVILEEGVMESLLADVQDFCNSADWYNQFGIPYHRGYLLHGPPGTGKTSLISAIAGHFNMNIGIICLSDYSLTDGTFARLLRSVPANTILLLEDIDAAFAPPGGERAEPKKKKYPVENPEGLYNYMNNDLGGFSRQLRSGLTFSGLLNALDGITAAEARILFMTTNHIETLDPALVRPGRVDVQKYIGPANDSQVARMFRRFHAEATDQEVQRFVRGVRDNVGCNKQTGRPNPITLAKLQEVMLKYKKSPSDVFDGLNILREGTDQGGRNWEADQGRFQSRQPQQNSPRTMDGGFNQDGFEMVSHGFPQQNWPAYGFRQP